MVGARATSKASAACSVSIRSSAVSFAQVSIATLTTSSSTPEPNYRSATSASQRQCGCQVIFVTIKAGLFHRHTRSTKAAAHNAIFEYIDNW